MRLIDATIQPLLLANYILERKNTFVRALEKADNDFLFAMLMDYFDEQPTAYDVDKVAEQLQEWTFNADIKLDNNSINRNLIVSETAIDIVKAGGTDER